MKKIVLIICLIISSITIYLFAKDRSIGYDQIPDNRIFDERNYALQGTSLRTNGIPIGWSDSGEYEHMPEGEISPKLEGLSIEVNGVKPTVTNYKDFPKPVISVNELDFGFGTQHLKLVQPFLDHPPLGGLIYSLGVPKSANNFLDINPSGYRKVSLDLAIVTSVLLFFFVLQVFKNPWISTLSVVAYNIAPSYLLMTRYALLENVVAPLSLLMLNLLILFTKLKKHKKISLAVISISGLVAGLTILAKESGVAFLAAGIFLLLYNKTERKYLIFYIMSSLIPIAAYLIWGSWIAPNLFKEIFVFNAGRRFLGSLNFINIFTFQWFKNFKFDGWWIWGFISLIFVFYNERKKAFFYTIPFVFSFITILFFAGMNFPWYYFSLIPYLAVASGYALWKIITDPDVALLTTFFVLPLSSSLYWGHFVMSSSISSLGYRLFMLIFVGFSFVRLMLKNNKIIKYIWIISSIILVIVLIKLNHQTLIYLITNWGKIMIPDFPAI